MAEDPQEALISLLASLREMGADDIAEDIEIVIARGETADSESKGSAKGHTQRPLTSNESYIVAVEILIASFEPLVMQHHALTNLNETGSDSNSIVWRSDYVEGSLIAPRRQTVDIPEFESGEIRGLTADLSRLVELLGER